MNYRFLVPLTALMASMVMAQTSVYDPSIGEGYYILTPEASDTPRINGPAVFGVRPRAPFLYTIPATGRRPMRFSVEGLPDGLQLDAETGRIYGLIADRTYRTYNLTLRAENKIGSSAEPFSIVVGNTICLTPPISWNYRESDINQECIIAVAKTMVDLGLKDHGWTYINMNDGWQGFRGGKHNAIQPDPEQFPDMKQMCDDIHAMGLKVGLYSSPWITTYAGFAGGSSDGADGEWNPDMGYETARKVMQSYHRVGRHTWDKQDAAQWADWGIDYLTYDRLFNGSNNEWRMARALKQCGRDIAYNLSNKAAFNEDQTKASELTPDEQYSHVTLWSLMSFWDSPLPIECPIESMDEFTLKLLTNSEVIDIHQDAKKSSIIKVYLESTRIIFVRDLSDKSKAIVLYNLGESPSLIELNWNKARLSGDYKLRDVWRQEDIGTYKDTFSARVPSQGVILLRATAVQQ